MATDAPAGAANPPPAATVKPARRRSLVWRVLRVALLLLIVLVVLLGAAIVFVMSPPGLRFVLDQARPFVVDAGGTLDTNEVSGSLWRGVKIGSLLYSDGQMSVAADGLDTDWSLSSLVQRKLIINHLRVANVQLQLPPGQDDPAPRQAIEMPGSLALPIEVRVDELRVDRFELLPAAPAPAAAPIVITDLALAMSYADGTYSINNFGVSSPWGVLAGGQVSMGAEVPHPVRLQLDASGTVDPVSYQLGLRGDGDLNRLGLSTAGTLAQAPIDLRATLNPLALSPLVAADLSLQKFAPQRLDPALPLASIALGVKVRTLDSSGEPLPHWRIDLQVDNTEAGALNAGKVPLRKLVTQVLLDDPLAGALQQVRLQELAISLPATRGSATIAGQVDIKLDEQQKVAGTTIPVVLADLAVQGLDIAQFAGPELATALTGAIKVSAQGFDIDLKQATGQQPLADSKPAVNSKPAAGPAQSASVTEPLLASLPTGQAMVKVSGKLDGETLHLTTARVEMGKARLQAKGKARIVSPIDIDLQGELARFDLNQWIPRSVALEPRWRQGIINGNWAVSGAIEPAPDLQMNLTLRDSQLAGQALSANVKAGLVMRAAGGLQQLRGIDARLDFGRNQISANGTLRAHAAPDTAKAGKSTASALNFNVLAADPAAIDARLDGSAELKGQLRGALDALHLSAELNGRRLRFAPTDGEPITLRSLDLSAQLPLAQPLPADAALDLSVRLGRLQVAGQRIDKTTLTLKGSPDKHQLRFDTLLSGQSLALIADGRAELADAPAWQGAITSLRSDGKMSIRSRAPAPLSASAERIELDDLKLAVSGGGARGALAIERLFLALGEQPSFAARGKIDALPVAQLASAFQTKALPEELNGLRLDGSFDLSGTSAEDLSGRVLAGITEIANAKKPIGLASNGSANQADIRFDNGQLDGNFELSLPSLAFTRRFTEPDWVVNGKVGVAGSVGGRLSEPSYNARINGTELALVQPALGWRLDRGSLDATVSDQRIELRELLLRTGEGRVELNGQARILTPSAGAESSVPLDGSFNLNTSGFIVPIGPGQSIILSGKTKLVANRDGMTWRGDMKVDEGLVEVAGSGAPSLPDDVQIVEVDKQGKVIVAPKADPTKTAENDAGIKVDTLLKLDLGEKLRVMGSGINARLTGNLELKGTLPADPRGEGLVKIVDGSYKAYSQDLQISDGEVRFNGPLDNPSLNIDAVRPNLPVTVGVGIRGTALSPRIELFSDPSSMSDAEKLSWLVLGVPIDNAQAGAQSLALKEAAARLLGSGDGSGGSFSDKIGLDSLGFGYASDTSQTQGVRDSGAPTGLPGAGGQTADTTYQEVVTLGKKLSDKLSVSYEQGVRGLWNLLRIQYELSSRLSLRAQTGSENAVDLLYFWSFD